MKSPSSRHLTHDFKAYKGLSLQELIVSGVFGIVVGMLLFAILGGLMFSRPGISAGVGVIAGFFAGIRLLPGLLSRLKEGKPEGYLKKSLLVQLAKTGLIQSIYLKHQGKWRTSRSLGDKHV